MCLYGQPALKVRLAASSKRGGNEWAWVVKAAPTAAAVWASARARSRVTLRKMPVKFSELDFFVELECQICAALAKVQPAQQPLRISSAFLNAGGAVEDTQGSCMVKWRLQRKFEWRSYPRSWRRFHSLKVRNKPDAGKPTARIWLK